MLVWIQVFWTVSQMTMPVRSLVRVSQFLLPGTSQETVRLLWSAYCQTRRMSGKWTTPPPLMLSLCHCQGKLWKLWRHNIIKWEPIYNVMDRQIWNFVVQCAHDGLILWYVQEFRNLEMLLLLDLDVHKLKMSVLRNYIINMCIGSSTHRNASRSQNIQWWWWQAWDA